MSDFPRALFVAAQAACVDWQGNVSPCQFLWHGYACSLYGEAKRVHPTQFGNICATPLVGIWRAPEFRVFREQARAGEYPPCSDISGVAGPFEQDCLGVPVPCGHCPWIVGQLMCLGSEPNPTRR